MIPAEIALAEIIPPNKQLTFVEVGTLRATTLVRLAEKFPLITFTGIDNFQPYTDPIHGNYTVTAAMSNYNKHIAEKNIRNSPQSNRIYLWVEDSSQAAKETTDQSFDIVFLDKNFTKESAKQDVLEWFPKVKNGGILAGHEAYTEEILSAVTDGMQHIKEAYGFENNLKIKHSIWYVIVNRTTKN